MFIRNERGGVPSSLCFVGILLLFIYLLIGWGHWGMGVYGDYALDAADALRVFQGEVPYRDFLPTYGPLYFMLVSPMYHWGAWFFPLLWLGTAFLIFLQGSLLTTVLSKVVSRLWVWVFVGLYYGAVAFAPTNAKFILGYSQSGFLGVWIWVFVFWMIWTFPQTNAKWGWVGAGLGLQLFTKMDLGIAACGVLGILFLVCLSQKSKRGVLYLLLGFGGVALGGWSLLILMGAEPYWILATALESFGQVSLIRDESLHFKMGLLACLGVGVVFVFSIRRFRRRLMRLREIGSLIVVIGFFVALVGDIWRGWPLGSIKQVVFLNYFWCFIGIWVASRGWSSVIRFRSLRMFQGRFFMGHLFLTLVGAVGILRVSITGWYPLNYYQPTLLILGILVLNQAWKRCCWRTELGLALVGILVLFLGCSVRANGFHRHEPKPVETPWGKIWALMDTVTFDDLLKSLELLKGEALKSTLMCTSEPSLQLLTGMKSAAFYTYFGRLGYTGRYQRAREEVVEERFQRFPPTWVVYEKERAVFAKRFGKDFGEKILERIERNYQTVYQSPSGSQTQRTIYRRQSLEERR